MQSDDDSMHILQSRWPSGCWTCDFWTFWPMGKIAGSRDKRITWSRKNHSRIQAKCNIGEGLIQNQHRTKTDLQPNQQIIQL